jgi:hypothetical protein
MMVGLDPAIIVLAIWKEKEDGRPEERGASGPGKARKGM